jgi:hypothetical protein
MNYVCAMKGHKAEESIYYFPFIAFFFVSKLILQIAILIYCGKQEGSPWNDYKHMHLQNPQRLSTTVCEKESTSTH